MNKWKSSLLFFLLFSCSYIPVDQISIKGSEVKSELRKAARNTFGLLVSAGNAILVDNQRLSGVAKQCPGFTTDTTNPSFKLPDPNEYTNVNLSATISGISNGTVTQNWVSEPITRVSYIDVGLVNTPSNCRYRLNAEPTASIFTNLSSTSPIAVETVPATLYIACTTSFGLTASFNYTISLNPRPQNLPRNLPNSDLGSLFNLYSEQTVPFAAGIKDETLYTYSSFEKCKSNFTLTALAYASAAPAANRIYQECGNYNPPPQQFLTQGFLCNLEEAKFIETN